MCTVVCSVREVCTWLHPYLRVFWSCTLSSAWHRWELAVWDDLLFTKVNGVCRVSSWHNCLVLSAPVPSLTWRADKTGKRPDLPCCVLPLCGITFYWSWHGSKKRMGRTPPPFSLACAYLVKPQMVTIGMNQTVHWPCDTFWILNIHLQMLHKCLIAS